MKHKMRGMLRFLDSLLICIYCESHDDIPGFHTDEGAVDWCPCKHIKNHTNSIQHHSTKTFTLPDCAIFCETNEA
jgi:hypothetical protein